jgi:hypothetical protein
MLLDEIKVKIKNIYSAMVPDKNKTRPWSKSNMNSFKRNCTIIWISDLVQTLEGTIWKEGQMFKAFEG